VRDEDSAALSVVWASVLVSSFKSGTSSVIFSAVEIVGLVVVSTLSSNFLSCRFYFVNVVSEVKNYVTRYSKAMQI